MRKGYRHLSYAKRLKIESLLLMKIEKKEIAKHIGVSLSTINREVKRGTYIHRNSDWTEEERYSPELAERRYRENMKKKGREIKIKGDEELIEYLTEKIVNQKNSPYAALESIKKEGKMFKTDICLSTFYNYIRNGVFPEIELADCPYHKVKKKKSKKKVQKRAARGTSIEQRPKEVLTRESAGHWEMDTVVGKKGESKTCLLVLTERTTRIEIVEKMKSHTMSEVVRILDKIERNIGEKKFREMFKSVTVDNGTEFSDFNGMERSRRNKKNRTNIFYCHPYCSSERGSNENQNRLIRRHIPKGADIDEYSNADIREIEKWMNEYPRKMFEGLSAAEVFYNVFQEEFWRMTS